MMRFLLPAALTVALLTGFAEAEPPHGWGSKSLELTPGMSEQQVIATVGESPSKGELSTCGGNPGIPTWKCKTLAFGDKWHGLLVIFSAAGNSWRTEEWRAW
jgi:hypothetical protein